MKRNLTVVVVVVVVVVVAAAAADPIPAYKTRTVTPCFFFSPKLAFSTTGRVQMPRAGIWNGLWNGLWKDLEQVSKATMSVACAPRVSLKIGPWANVVCGVLYGSGCSDIV